MAALAGLILAARFGSTRPDIGTGLELSVITAVVLGGVDINGGKGTMLGAVLSLLLIGLMRFGMGLLNIQGQVQGIVIGMLLILSILVPAWCRVISQRPPEFQLAFSRFRSRFSPGLYSVLRFFLLVSGAGDRRWLMSVFRCGFTGLA